MNFKHISPLLAASILGVSSVPAWGESELPTNLSFSCQVENGVPVTFVEAEGNKQSIFHWNNDSLSESIEPDFVCSDVALRLNNYAAMGYDMSNLGFIGSEQVGLPAICATQDTTSADCSVLLLTLAPTEAPSATARGFLSSIIDKALETDKVELNDRGFQSTVYPVNFWKLVLGRKLLK
ncbi:MAG: COP23 domain-containing protein [Xenococcaceae cyanobacterium MO_207.B15]|nr:COP23 domain-containing protein [Xenococcaceae cyanobacterium MO_207.B15]MDJ0743338.1 COP23 domain-containing protein [Xenococcaceae cyanobacterium MO_167.B27]